MVIILFRYATECRRHMQAQGYLDFVTTVLVERQSFFQLKFIHKSIYCIALI